MGWSTRRRAAVCVMMSCVSVCYGSAGGASRDARSEYNPVARAPVSIGREAVRFVVGFRKTGAGTAIQTIRRAGRTDTVVQARTDATDVTNLARRSHLPLAASRQLTPSMHVLTMDHQMYGAEVESVLAALRADRAVKFADVDERRYPLTLPDDPLFTPSADGSGQWFMLTPGAPRSGDLAATDAVSAWSITTGSTGIVIADIDTGVRFDHPDLARAGLGGRLLPGYDFVAEDQSPSNGAHLGTFLIANDGDGWDPDPSDPGDWISAADQANPLFPASSCPIADSSWHGTRVMGLLGALTNNAIGVAGMTWTPYLLPVRALGKCGGYDSDIIVGMEWAAGMAVTGVPDNPFPASIVNLSVGASGSCPASYADAVTALTGMGVLIVASAGNANGPVDAPGNCAGVLGVAGLRNVGTKVGYSSFGPQIALSAPAGNCINSSGACLRSIDTTTNSGTTVPANDTYTNQLNPNLGTSFSAPLVGGIAAMMRTVNGNLTPALLTARLKSSAAAFPQPAGLPVCPSLDPISGECACPNDGSQCGAGMVNANGAVIAAQRPIAAVALPAGAPTGASVALDASGSAAACGRTIASYAWLASGAVTVQSGAASSVATINAHGAGTVTLTVADDAGATDTATLSVAADGVITAAPATAATTGGAAGACPTPFPVNPVAPSLTTAFTPPSVGENQVSTLTITLGNDNAFALTQSTLTGNLPANLSIAAVGSGNPAPATTCSGAGVSLTNTANQVRLSAAIIPAKGECTVTVPVQTSSPGSYLLSLPANSLATGPAGENTAAATASLTVTAPASGGGSLGPWPVLIGAATVYAARRRPRRANPWSR